MVRAVRRRPATSSPSTTTRGGARQPPHVPRSPRPATTSSPSTGFTVLPADPFDPASGDGAGSEGAVQPRASTSARPDLDFYAVQLRKGDVLGASVDRRGRPDRRSTTPPAARCTAPTRTPRSSTRRTARCPAAATRSPSTSPTRTGCTTSPSAAAAGDYDITVEAYRPALEGDKTAADHLPRLRRASGSTPASSAGPGVRDAEPAAGLPRPLGPDQRRRERR